MRARRIGAIAWRDLRRVFAGRAGYRLPALALALLLPVGALRLPNLGAAPPVQATAAGEIPASLQGLVGSDPKAPASLRGQAPVVVEASTVSPALRTALDTLPGPKLALRHVGPPARLPGRSLLVALLAISLLTGPLAESLPGERSARTLEVLLSAGVSRSEIAAGKALAWTAFGSLAALLAAAGGLASGAQTAGLWPLALPAVVGCAVALGLWLVRRAEDVVGGAAVPMRVLPAAALGMGGLAWGLARIDPALGAAVPLGGALLVASGVLTGPGPLLAAWVGSGAAAMAMLGATAAALDRGETGRAPSTGRGLGLVAAAGALWVGAVAGPGVWALAGNPNLALPAGANLAAGGVLLALLAAVVSARDGELPGRLGTPREWGMGIATGLVIVGIVRLGPTVNTVHFSQSWASVTDRLVANPFSSGLGPGLAVVVGQTLLFRGVLARRIGVFGAVLAWVAVASPLDPVLGLAVGGLLGLAAKRWGLGAAGLAQGIGAWGQVYLHMT